MPTPLPGPYLPDISQTINAARMGDADRLAKHQRGVLQTAGQQAAEGSLGQARKSLLAEGMFKEADHIGQMIRQVDADKLSKVKKTYDVLGNLARTADSPEKWQQMIQAASQAGMDVAKYGDFGMRDLVLAQSGKIGEHLDYELKNRGLDLKQQALDQKAATIGQPKPKTMNFGDVEKLAGKGVQLENVNRYNQSFQDDFAGYGKGGETTMWTARNMPFLTGETTEKAATFWNDYDRYKNQVRNELFGSALTETEKEEFNKADISPNMDPKQIRANLARQQEATKSALVKTVKAMAASGYSPEAIEQAVGVPLESLVDNAPPQQPPSAAGGGTPDDPLGILN